MGDRQDFLEQVRLKLNLEEELPFIIMLTAPLCIYLVTTYMALKV